MHGRYRIRNVFDEQAVLPKAEWKRIEDCPELAARRTDLRQEVLDRLRRFGMAFDPDRWDSVSVNPYMREGLLAYWGVYGETVVVEGQFYVNDVIDGDHCFVSPTDHPFWCLHQCVFETDDADLHRRLSAELPGLPDKAEGGPVPGRLAKAAALYVIQKAGPGELTLEANRETGQRLLIGPGCCTAVYEYWDTLLPEPQSTTQFDSADAAADFLVRHGFIRISDDYQAEGVLADRLLDWLSRENPPATVRDLARLVRM
jgi:hypothetical protein